MSTSTPTPYPHISLAVTDDPDAIRALTRDGSATVVIADPQVAHQVQEQTALPPLPSGEFGARLVAEAADFGVLVRAVSWAALVMDDATIGPLLIVGTQRQCAAVMAAAERSLAAMPGRSA